jgi:hypothetical protein
MKRPDPFTAGLIIALAVMLLWLFGLLGKMSWSFLIPSAGAAEAELTWTPPTQNTDNSPIPATGPGALTQHSILYGACNAGKTALLAAPPPVTVVVPMPAATRIITGLGAGSWCFAARAETASAQSVFTPFVSKDIILQPKPPTGLVVTALVAYTVVKQRDAFVMLPVGTVPGGTACDSSQSVNGYFVVPRAAVTWSGNVRPEVVVASCG